MLTRTPIRVRMGTPYPIKGRIICWANGTTGRKPGVCDTCPLREHCTTSKTGRTVTRSQYEEQWERQREHAQTPQAVMGKVLRGIIAEGKFAEAVRHGLKTMRYVGKQMAVLQSTLVAFILNVKRLVRLEVQGGVRELVSSSWGWGVS